MVQRRVIRGFRGGSAKVSSQNLVAEALMAHTGFERHPSRMSVPILCPQRPINPKARRIENRKALLLQGFSEWAVLGSNQ